jgi:SAM-dependent methyltransferase
MNDRIRGKKELLKVLGAYRETETLYAAIELGVFDTMAAGPMTAEQAARRISASLRGTEILLNALSALGLLEKRGGKFSLAPVAEKHLVSGAPESILSIAHHSSNLRRIWIDLPYAVKTGKPVPRPGKKTQKSDAARHSAFIAAMHEHAREQAVQFAKILDLSDVKKALDVGGGPGTYLFAMIRRNPEIKGAIFDLPRTAAIAREMIQQHGFNHAVGTIEGDFLTDDLGDGFDLVLMSSIIHINSPAENVKLIKKSFNALNPGGRLAIKDSMLDDSKTQPADAALFSVNMLVNTHSGASYSKNEIRSWMRQAGFTEIHFLEMPPRFSVAIGNRPKSGRKK